MDTSFDFEEIPYRYIIGIDLGTTNSALAYVDRTRPDPECRQIRFLTIPQLTAPGEMGRLPILPSFLYIPGSYELPPETTALPWDSKRDYVVGEFAREQGALVPGRLVSSAKSWLCHGGVDRTGAILPWGAGSDIRKVSPVEASARYLQHMREAWNDVMARGREGYRLEEQLIVLTVPASFDEVARELTVSAARTAGLSRVILVEEPLAAFYAWLSGHEADWQSRMRAGQMILVCDVGGGTTDFTIVAIREGEKGLRFDRLAVGDHLMLGGDNMDLSLARHLEIQLLGQPGRLESRRWHQLWHQCRKAKEALLGDTPLPAVPAGEAPEKKKGSSLFMQRLGAAPPTSPPPSRDTEEPHIDITIMGSGRKLIADVLKGALTRSQVEQLILEGFFPFVASDDLPRDGGRRAGLTEWGLPYVQDPAVTRHLSAFWQRFRSLLSQETGRSVLYPDFLLFNGGALTPVSIRNRILAVVQSWFKAEAGEDWTPVELENPRPELSVAVGAAYYGLVRQGEGVRVGAGSPRAYYVEVAGGTAARASETAAAKTGTKTSVEASELPEQLLEPGTDEEAEPEAMRTAVCLVPRGTEEGFETQLDQPAFEVLTNKPATFQLLSSNTRLGDHLGDVVTLSDREIAPLPPIRTVLRYGKRSTAQTLPVKLAIHLTEIGTLELWCRSQQTPHQWQLQFDVRQMGEPEAPSRQEAGETLDANLIQEAQKKILAVFRGGQAPPRSPERLVKDMVTTLDLGKEKWTTSLIRKLADTLLECKQGRGLTPQHEARWLNLLGFCLRPGFGDPLDEWRIKEIWKIYPQGLQYPRQVQTRSEWWIFWRRIAGGLTAGHQWHVYQQLSPSLQPLDKKKKKILTKTTKTMSPQEEIEIRMMMASFERLPAAVKVELGRLFLRQMGKDKLKPQDLWVISRLGARVLFHGPLDQVIPSQEASAWLKTLLDPSPEPTDTLAQALVQLARLTGDRERDLPQDDRDRLARWLEQLPRGHRHIELLTNPETTLGLQERDWMFGEALPSGLILAD